MHDIVSIYRIAMQDGRHVSRWKAGQGQLRFGVEPSQLRRTLQPEGHAAPATCEIPGQLYAGG
jgi:hypothetical protein